MSLVTPMIAVCIGVSLGGEAFDARNVAGAAPVVMGVWMALAQKPPARSTARASSLGRP